MEILKSTLFVGVERPFVFLHVSDIHLAETDENDSEERRLFAVKRKKYFPFAMEAYDFVRDYVRETGYPLVNTGDMLDFVTPENVRLTRQFARETDMMMAVGNHEYWRCHNDRFHYDDVPETYAKKAETLDLISEKIGIDMRFTHREIGGVNFVCMDNSAYDIDAEVFERLKAVEAEGKPILLFMHIPLYSEYLGNSGKCSLCPPMRFFENCHPTDVWERTPSALTFEICEYIRNSPYIRYVISGHVHRNLEIIGLDRQNQIITGCNTIREITVV